MRYAAYIAAIAMLLGITVVSHAQDYESLTIAELDFVAPDVERFELDNDLVVHFYEDHSLPLVALDATFRLGEINVAGAKAGLAELCGTLLRTGGTESTPPDEFNQQLDFVGASLYSHVGTESGAAQLRVLRKDFELGMRLLSEMLIEPRFDQEKFEIAVENKLEGIRRENDNPNLITRREFYRSLFPDHPYGRSATAETVSSVTRDDLVDFHRSHYHPDNCIIALSGDLTLAEAVDYVEKYLGGWQHSNGDKPDFQPVPDSKPGVYYVHKDLSQSFLRIGHLGIDRNNPDRHKVMVMNFILGGGGFISRLSNKIRVQEGLAYTVGSNFYQMDESGSFYCYCQTKSETTVRAIEMMIAEIRKLMDEGVSEEELEVAKNSIVNSDIFEYATPHQIVTQQSTFEFHGYPADYGTKRIEAIKAVTVEDVKQMASTYLHPDSLIIIAVGNQELFDKPLSNLGEVVEIQID